MGRKIINNRKNYPILICKPHNVQFQTDERVNNWIMKQYGKGLAEYMSVPSKLPELARNYFIDVFLHAEQFKKKTHIFFIDADTVPVSEWALERLLSHDKPVVAGVTPIMRGKLTNTDVISCSWSCLKEKNERGEFETYGIDELPTKLFKSPRVGGTTILIKREVLEKLSKPYQKCEWDEDMRVQKLSEDFYFSDKIIEAGYDIWVDPMIKCHHYHYVDMLDQFEIYSAAAKLKRQAGK
jgi:hypothetical protein